MNIQEAEQKITELQTQLEEHQKRGDQWKDRCNQYQVRVRGWEERFALYEKEGAINLQIIHELQEDLQKRDEEIQAGKEELLQTHRLAVKLLNFGIQKLQQTPERS